MSLVLFCRVLFQPSPFRSTISTKAAPQIPPPPPRSPPSEWSNAPAPSSSHPSSRNPINPSLAHPLHPPNRHFLHWPCPTTSTAETLPPTPPSPPASFPVYSADGKQRDSFSVLSGAAATAGDHTIHAPDSHHGPRKSVPTATVDHANRNHPDSARHVATASPAPSNAGSGTSSRKVSVANAPDPTRLMRMKGETYFAEMIDRVWESRGRVAAEVTRRWFRPWPGRVSTGSRGKSRSVCRLWRSMSWWRCARTWMDWRRKPRRWRSGRPRWSMRIMCCGRRMSCWGTPWIIRHRRWRIMVGWTWRRVGVGWGCDTNAPGAVIANIKNLADFFLYRSFMCLLIRLLVAFFLLCTLMIVCFGSAVYILSIWRCFRLVLQFYLWSSVAFR